VTTFVRNVPCARGQRRKSNFFLFRDIPRVFLTRARKGHWGQKSKLNLQQLDIEVGEVGR
jgi:hypothetical protein